MGFNAAERVSALDYDFTTMDPCPPGLTRCKGTIPEPTDELLDSFNERFRKLMQLLAKVSLNINAIEEPEPESTPVPAPLAEAGFEPVEDGSVESITVKESHEPLTVETIKVPERLTIDEALAKWRETDGDLAEGRKKANAAVVELLADICQGSPSKAEIEAMPSRIRSAFIQWLVAELLTPKEEMIAMTYSAEETPDE